jgi:hypothetical protein
LGGRRRGWEGRKAEEVREGGRGQGHMHTETDEEEGGATGPEGGGGGGEPGHGMWGSNAQGGGLNYNKVVGCREGWGMW